MPATILSDNGVSSGSAGIKTTGSNDGTLALQTTTAGGTATTALTINTTQAIGVGSSPSYGTSGQFLTSGGSGASPTWTTAASSQWTTSGSNIYYNTGKVGIGTTSPSTLLQIGSGGGSGATNSIAYLGGYSSGVSQLRYIMNHNGAANAGIGTPSAGGILFGYGLVDGTVSGEWMRINTSGDVFIGATSAANVEKLGVTYNSQDRLGFVLNDTYTGAGGAQIAIQFRRNGSAIGSITTTTTTTSYNITSDYRLKEDFRNYSGLDLISKIKTYDYKWKKSEDRMFGVKAHELQEVIPYAVTGEKDAEQMQSVDYSKLVPILVQAIQELKAEIEILKNK